MKSFVGIFLCAIVVSSVHAQTGTVTVLEAPMFRIPDSKSQVIQYLRKGEDIYIHPKEFNRDKFKDLVHSSENLEDDTDFYQTLDNLGRDAYVLKEHIFLNYRDYRERDQKVISFDNTDYRPKEELPPDYPLIKINEYRGQLNIGLARSFRQSYPYTEEISDQGTGIDTEINFNWANHVKWEEEKRLFFGGNILIGFHENNYSLEKFTTNEKAFRVGVGPYLSYDMWRNKKYRLSASIAIPFNFVNTKDISFKELATNNKIKSEYKAINIEPRIGTNLQVKDLFHKADLVLGLNTIFIPPFSYSLVKSSSEAASIDRVLRKSSINESLQIVGSFFLGVQTDY
jgi:hypothetical protein